MNIKHAKSLIKALYKQQIETGVRYSVELVSGPGIGKSSMVKQLAVELGKELATPMGCKVEFLSTREQPDVAGFALPAKDVDGTHIMIRTKAPWMPGAKDPANGILLFDEFAQAAPEVVKPAAEILLNGRAGESQLPIGWMVIAASNRVSDRSGVHKMMAFTENRRMLIEITPDVDAFIEWAEGAGLHPFAVAFAKAFPGLVFKDSVPKEPGPFCTPRTLALVAGLIDALPMHQLTHAAYGYMGEGAGHQFMAYMTMAKELDSYENVVANPEGAKLPTRPDTNYAMVQLLAYHLKPAHLKPIHKYLKRMAREYQIAAVQTCVRRHGESLLLSREFGDWFKDKEVLELLQAAQALRNS